MRNTLLAVAVLPCLAVSVHAQCRVGKETNEAKLLAYYAVPLVFSPSGELERLAPGAVRLGLEATWIPKPRDALRQTSICFKPKEENSQLSPVAPRPRVTVGLPAGFAIEASYLPPLTVADATPNMGSVALSFVRSLSGGLSLALRAHGTFGRVKGPITCPDDALQLTDPDLACYGTEKSSDTYRPNVAGAEAALTWQRSGAAGGRGLAGYVGAGYSSLRPRFQVGFQPQGSPYDNTRVVVDLSRFAAMLGGRYRARPNLDITGEAYSVPKDMTTVRLGVSWALR